MELYRFAIEHDWPILAPILVCSVIALAVTIERSIVYLRQRAGAAELLRELERDLRRGAPDPKAWAELDTGIVGRVAADGIRIAAEHPERFEALFDVSASLATRQLERNLSILGTIATISPYLGLFGTVVRILLTFGELAKSGGGSSAAIMSGIGSALIATAFGLGVAIFAVAAHNTFQSKVERFVKDFDLIKLMCLSSLTREPARATRGLAPTWDDEGVRI